jgi:PIN domain nuclease of toxin-antitoxin system
VRYLLDTHAVRWSASDSIRLSATVCRLVKERPPADLGVAAITLLEMARLGRAGEGDLKPAPAGWLEDLPPRYIILPFTPAVAWRTVNLEWSHRDSADRIIGATAREHGLTLITRDREITRWGGVPVLR